jgi:hypothetical protein
MADFFEPNEPVQNVVKAFAAGKKRRTSPRKLRRAGSRWRVLVHEPNGQSHSIAHNPRFGGLTGDSDTYRNHTLPGTELDEVVVGDWLHLEQLDTGRWYLHVAGVRLAIHADRDGHPLSVSVYGPGTYLSAVEDCRYEVAWAPPE